MRKFVIGLVAVLALFVFIQSYSNVEAPQKPGSMTEARVQIIP